MVWTQTSFSAPCTEDLQRAFLAATPFWCAQNIKYVVLACNANIQYKHMTNAQAIFQKVLFISTDMCVNVMFSLPSSYRSKRAFFYPLFLFRAHWAKNEVWVWTKLLIFEFLIDCPVKHTCSSSVFGIHPF